MNAEEKVVPVRLDALLSYLTGQGSLWDGPYEKRSPAPEEKEAICRSEAPRLFEKETQSASHVLLKLLLKRSERVYSIEGEADRVFLIDGVYYIEEEIALKNREDFSGRVKEYSLLRGQFLALALMNAKALKSAAVRLTVYAAGTREYQETLFSREELSLVLRERGAELDGLLPLFEKETPRVAFPYEHLRRGQKDLIRETWDSIKAGRRLFACAPTGIGKTEAVLYPALRALQKGYAEKVFYASPKNTLKKQAADAVKRLSTGSDLKLLVLSAKMALCPEKCEECQERVCPYAEGFYERLPAALPRLMRSARIDEEELAAVAEEFTVCPFELALEAMKFCQVVIGDYNHVFDPVVALTPGGKDKILLVDEAHNLPDRVRQNYTESLLPGDLDPFFSSESRVVGMVRESFADLLAFFAAGRKAYPERKLPYTFEKPEKFLELIRPLPRAMSFALGGGFGTPDEEEKRLLSTLKRKAKKLLALGEDFDADYTTVFLPDGGVEIHLTDPKEKIQSATEKWKSAVLFSATLLPQSYYAGLFGCREDEKYLILPSPFPRDNLFVGICEVDVSYSQRFSTAKKLCSIIHTTAAARPGNYMVFLPSFEYLDAVSQEYCRRFIQDEVYVQKRNMKRSERNAFLEVFRSNRRGTVIGFCVMGGVFSEGIDLQGESLIGEVIVGMGFPPPSARGEAECALYYKKEIDGKSYAYTLPGWNRVLQAAGRVIRSEEDRGAIILCDMRYIGEDVRELFPEAWEDAEICDSEAKLAAKLERFWR